MGWAEEEAWDSAAEAEAEGWAKAARAVARAQAQVQAQVQGQAQVQAQVLAPTPAQSRQFDQTPWAEETPRVQPRAKSCLVNRAALARERDIPPPPQFPQAA